MGQSREKRGGRRKEREGGQYRGQNCTDPYRSACCTADGGRKGLKLHVDRRRERRDEGKGRRGREERKGETRERKNKV